METASHPDLRVLLAGGDRRSIAESRRARALIEKNQVLVSELATLTGDEDWLVAERSLDLMEKLAHDHPEWIEPHKKIFIGPLTQSDKWEIRLQIVRALPLFRWSPAQLRRVEETLVANLAFPQTFVRAWALDSLSTLAERNTALKPIVQRHLSEFEESSSKALQARARHIRARLTPESMRTPLSTSAAAQTEHLLLSPWRTNCRVTRSLIAHLPPAIWAQRVPGMPRRTIRMLAAHLHNARSRWIKTLGVPWGIPQPPLVNLHTVTRRSLLAALRGSDKGIEALIRLGLREGGRVPPTAAYVWRNLPLDVGHVLTYFVAHEAHHRGQLVLAARQLGSPLPKEVTTGLWQWQSARRVNDR